MAQDDFDLREMLGEPEDDGVKPPTIEDVPASQLPLTSVVKEEKIDARVAAASKPTYIADGHKVETLSHPVPLVPMDTDVPPPPSAVMSQMVNDEVGTLDEEYHATFNATIVEVKDLEPEALQALRHRLDRMIRRAKIQQRAIRVTEEGKLALITEKRRASIKAKDAEFMSRRKAQGDASPDGVQKREKRAKTEKDEALSKAEKQIKQFVKLNMNEATIRTTLQAVGTPIPENLADLITKFKK